MKTLVFTCGPASEDAENLRRLCETASSLRLNIAHLQAASLELWLERLVKMRAEVGREFRIILDLQGAKVRIGRFPDVQRLPEKVELFLGEQSDVDGRIPVPAASVFAHTSPGDRLLLNDRRVIVKITHKTEGVLTAVVEQNGPLSSGKGLNSPDRGFELARVTPQDAEAIELSRHIAGLDYAISFVADGSEISLFRPLIDEKHRLIAKIERQAAFEHLAAIAANFAELWLCRGDLGAECGLKKLGEMQKRFVAAIPQLQRPCILAGEVLGSMVTRPAPSRAEIVQLHDAMNCGFSGMVLSDETACGQHVQAVIEFVRFFFNDERQ
ncbi:MAG: pyruvate kinase [Candidatus Riflebacteria bacterium]|nr:pyruvate kinase [Candidatus Riflebacteria bacterium]